MRFIVNVFILCPILFSFCIFSQEISLELVQSIGDEREDYTFFQIRDAEISESHVFIVDGKGHFIAKHNFLKDGIFVKRVGQKGQGPGDFNRPSLIDIENKFLYLHDFSNYRIIKMDQDLHFLKYIKLEKNFHSVFFTLDNSNFLGDLFFLREDYGRIMIVNKKGNIVENFFNETSLGMIKNYSDRLKLASLSGMGSLKVGMNKLVNELVISFFVPDNPIRFFHYSVNNKLIKEFSYTIENKYKFPKHTLSFPMKKPFEYSYSKINGLFFKNKRIIVFLSKINFKGKKVASKMNECLVFDLNGSLVAKKNIDSDFIYFSLSKENYLTVVDREDEIEKLYIYKLIYP